ncbi:MAG: hypothetical protein AMXMBFR36_18760 [Acidobacteriota bacterium]
MPGAIRTSPTVAGSWLISLWVFTSAGVVAGQETSVGLSTVRAQQYAKGPETSAPPRPDDRFAWSLAAGDFDGDGTDDLANGVPFSDGPFGDEVEDCGVVAVRYGRLRRGLADAEGDIVSQLLFNGAEAGDEFGTALAACDFDGDGFDDLAVGAPGEDLGPALRKAGAVNVFYGSSSGLASPRVQSFDEDTAGIPGSAAGLDQFGFELACADFDADGHDDLAVGAPTKTIDGDIFAGAVFVLPGSAIGLVATSSFALDQDQPLVTGEAEPEDRFGFALATGDFDGDGFDDLAVGVPVEDSNGAFHVFFGSVSGLSGDDTVYRDETGLGGLSELGDAFAAELVAGDFDGDGRADLAIGIPLEDFAATMNCGQVNVVYGGPGGFDFGRTQFWAQDNILGAGTSENGDDFGWAAAAGDFDGDGRDDLAVGSPGEFVTGPRDGAATVFMGSAAGLSAARRRGIASGLDGWPGDATEHERFLSNAMTAGDFDGDGHGDLVLGAPLEDVDFRTDVGTETVIYGSLFADGFETGDAGLWSASVP